MLIVIEIEEMAVALNNMWRESKEIEGDFHPILMELGTSSRLFLVVVVPWDLHLIFMWHNKAIWQYTFLDDKLN